MENSSKLDSVQGSDQVIEVAADTTTVCCRGTGNALGHPAVYLTFSDQDTVQCYYCGCVYKRVMSSVESSTNT